MTSTHIYKAAAKLMTEGHADHCMQVLNKFPEGEWFSPTNNGNNDYDVCEYLAGFCLIETKRTPKFHDGSSKGMHVHFRYRTDLKYI